MVAQFTIDGTIKTSLGKVLFSEDEPTVEEIRELVDLFLRRYPGGFPFNRGGVAGRRGANGPQGPQGPAHGGVGSQGAQGAQGPAGNAGSPGVQGAQGPGGSAVAGAQGSQGANGSSVVGPQGEAGATGAQGPAGSQGASGATGAQGGSGAQGAAGAAGAQGAVGTDGSLLNASIFEFSHTSGSASTGALGFTPLIAIYVGASTSSDFQRGNIAVTFITGTGIGGARTSEFALYGDDPTSSGVIYNAWLMEDNFYGTVLTDPTYGGGFLGEVTPSNTASGGLTCTAYGAGGIDLDWGFLPPSVAFHAGKLLVLG